MDNQKKLRITEIFEQLENAYKKYGDIALAMRIGADTMVAIKQVGISEVEAGGSGVDNFYFCFSPDFIQPGEDSGSSTSTSS